MKLNHVLKRLPLWYKTGKCVYLKSAPGRGKTTVLSEAPAMLSKLLNKNIGLVIINGPLLTPADSIGYLVPKHTDNFSESVYTSPFWWRTSEGKRLEEYDGGIIVVDEADKMDPDVKKVIGEAALSGRLGPHVLPKGWIVWMAGNRSQDRSGSTKELDHLINRRMELDVTDDLESWIDYATKAGVSPLAIAFANQNPQIVFSEKAPEKQGPWCTPRSLVEADRFLSVMRESNDGEIPDEPELIEEVGGMIGHGEAAQFFAFVKLERSMPKYARIVAAPMEAKVPNAPDAQMLVCFSLAHRVQADDVAAVIKYVDRMPKEFAVIFAKAACQRDFKILQTPAMNKWTMANSVLISALQR